jgi:tryptophanyl-tRNA synthetase
MKRLVSGIQPTGALHLGNYLGSLKNWIELLNSGQYNALMFIADLHSITVPYDPAMLKNNVLHTAATYLACGLDPDKASIFIQSDIPEHTELNWILSCFTSVGWMNRMTQFKDKSQKYKDDRVTLGLYSYPVLMAADVLLYNADFVPVGEDQKQHVELMRDISQAFNRELKTDWFITPEPMIMGEAKRVMSLKDGTKKMSKSDDSDYSRINLTDSADMIMSKFKKAKTDSIAEITYDPDNRPDISNLLKIFSVLSGIKIDKLVETYSTSGFNKFKTDLADLTISVVEPIAKKTKEFVDNRDYVISVLRQGRLQAKSIAEKNLAKIKEIAGFFSS